MSMFGNISSVIALKKLIDINVTHLEVDNLAKTMLQYYLKGVRL